MRVMRTKMNSGKYGRNSKLRVLRVLLRARYARIKLIVERRRQAGGLNANVGRILMVHMLTTPGDGSSKHLPPYLLCLPLPLAQETLQNHAHYLLQKTILRDDAVRVCGLHTRLQAVEMAYLHRNYICQRIEGRIMLNTGTEIDREYVFPFFSFIIDLLLPSPMYSKYWNLFNTSY